MRDAGSLVTVGVRVTEGLVTRLDRLARRLSTSGIEVCRSDVLRMAVRRGVNELELLGLDVLSSTAEQAEEEDA